MKDMWTVDDLNNVGAKTSDSPDVYIPYDETSLEAFWLVEMARGEEEIEHTGVINYDATRSPEQILNYKTIAYLLILKKFY